VIPGLRVLRVIKLTLDSSKRYDEDIEFNYVSVDPSSKADLTKVYITTDTYRYPIALAYSPLYLPSRRLTLTWEASEIGKELIIVLSDIKVFEANIQDLYSVAYLSQINSKIDALAKELQLLARESTQQLLHANDYKLITLDLSVARSDTLIIDNVISFCVVDVSAGAKYSIKLFDTAHDPLDQSIASKGFCVERLARASIYITNTAQSGYYLKLLVLRRV
jgi:hypothetical protein